MAAAVITAFKISAWSGNGFAERGAAVPLQRQGLPQDRISLELRISRATPGQDPYAWRAKRARNTRPAKQLP
jgi:hypothetical protein